MYRFITTVNIRKGPSTSSDCIGKKRSGDIVEVTYFIENEGREWGIFEEHGEECYFCARDTNDEYYIVQCNQSTYSTENEMLQNTSSYNAVKKEGCNFLCACYLGGLNNIDEADDCFEWASTTKYSGNLTMVRRRDSYVNMNNKDLARAIAQRYDRQMRDGKIVHGNNHFYVVDHNGIEIFNSVRPGYGH
jgi:hypothetical protein